MLSHGRSCGYNHMVALNFPFTVSLSSSIPFFLQLSLPEMSLSHTPSFPCHVSRSAFPLLLLSLSQTQFTSASHYIKKKELVSWDSEQPAVGKHCQRTTHCRRQTAAPLTHLRPNTIILIYEGVLGCRALPWVGPRVRQMRGKLTQRSV